MIDGPISFLFMMALLGSAVVGGISLIVSIVAVTRVRLRQRAIRALIVGAGVALLALVAVGGLIAFTLNEGDDKASLFKQTNCSQIVRSRRKAVFSSPGLSAAVAVFTLMGPTGLEPVTSCV